MPYMQNFKKLQSQKDSITIKDPYGEENKEEDNEEPQFTPTLAQTRLSKVTLEERLEMEKEKKKIEEK